jgi:hypothetical protein
VTGRPRPLGRLADLFVFAPLGFLLEAPRLLPELAEAGRRSLLGCRVVGRLRTERAPAGPGRTLRPTPGAAAGLADEALVDPAEEVVITVEREEEPAEPPLPIPGYDQLAASQVIARLPGLSPTELARIEDHETAHRHRRTVLAKIAQLRT